MTRVATIPLQSVLISGIQRAQSQIAVSQQQLASGSKAPDYATLGTDGVRTVSAHSMLARQQAESTATTQAGTTLALQDTALTAIDGSASDLRTQLQTAIGSGQSSGLQSTIQAAFDQYRSALNTTEGGIAVFGGAQTDTPPFTPATLADLTTTDAPAAFANDQKRATVRVGENQDLTVGVLASDAGGGLFDAFKALAQAGTIGTTLTDAQKTALSDAVKKLDSGISQLRDVNAENGRKMAQVDTLGTRAQARNTLLKGIVSDNEDADLGQVAIDLATRKSALEASYSVFGQLSRMSLVSYLQ
ncbi:flagellin [Sphingomonas sp. GC_Shp_3]|uniref:flagellin n=1 Tax=Sphingomonas sp. GC_Shp_3 TaxID=2937383 RepID=UPI002269A2E7|nr:flagellin [Sphingomonas sp. GC_Shp_3]